MDDTPLPDKISREPLLRSYIKNMTTYLTRQNAALFKTPDTVRFKKKIDGKWIDMNEEEKTFALQREIEKTKQVNSRMEDFIADFLKQYIQGNIKIPKVKTVFHEHYGDAEEKDYNLLEFTSNISSKIISPSGSVYKTAKEHPSFLREKIIEDKAGRAREKKLMFEAAAAGNKDSVNSHNNNQSLLKISMNSIIGAMGSAYSFLSDMAGFNSVTSISRYLIMNAYAQTERLLESNFYFPTVEHVINHIVVVCRSCPTKNTIQTLMEKYNLYIPDWNDVFQFLNENYRKYHPKDLPVSISDMLFHMPQHELSYIYYFSNLKNIIMKNEVKFKQWIEDFFNEDLAFTYNDPTTIDPTQLFKLDGMLITLISTVYSDELPLEASGKKVSIYDTVKLYPDIAKRLVAIGLYMQNKLTNEFDEVFQFFLDNGTTVPHTIEHKNMFRNCVILSDTDSVIFTTKSWLNWYTGEYRINKDAYKINSLVVYWLSKAIVYILKNVSIARGALGDDVKVMQMKNEFFYPVMVQSSLKKHYAGLIAVQEGVVLPKLKSDIKGINFRGSKLSDITKTFVKNYIDETNTLLIQNGKVSARERIWKVVEFEHRVYTSIKNGELTFLNVVPVKNADEYEDEDRSIYFNYQFWEAVFGDKYGSIMIPTKCFSLPLLDINNPQYLEYLKKTDKDIYKRMIGFIQANPKKKITRVPINPVTDKIPDELIPIMYTRQVVHDNSAALALFLKSFGINIGNNSKSRILFSEVYGGLQ